MTERVQRLRSPLCVNAIKCRKSGKPDLRCRIVRALARFRRVCPSHRRHDKLLATAGARIDVGTGAEAKVPAEADAHLAETPAVAGQCRRG
jgi:hypothetical protein